MSEETRDWLVRVAKDSEVLAEAYRLRLVGRLWWANMFLVVLPAAAATAAAAFAASSAGSQTRVSLIGPILAAALAGGAAVMTAVHKSLRCEEYQSECLRLSQGYRGIAVLARYALSNSDQETCRTITTKLETLTETAKAPLPTKYICRAEKMLNHKLHVNCPKEPPTGDTTASSAAGAR